MNKKYPNNKKIWSESDILLMLKMQKEGRSRDEQIEALGRSWHAIAGKSWLERKRRGMLESIIKRPPLPVSKMRPHSIVYVAYKGDQYLTEGTAASIAHQMDKNIMTVYYYASTRHKQADKGNRITLTRLGYVRDLYDV